MTIDYLVAKIRRLQAEERRLAYRLERARDRDAARNELEDHRRNVMSWYTRLAAEILAIPQRRLSALPALIQTASDPGLLLDYRLEQLKLKRELAILDVNKEIQKLLS